MDRLQFLSIELEEHTQADHDYKISVGTVLSLARRASEIFERSESYEKRQFINFLVQNPKMRDRELAFDLRKPLDSVLDLASMQNENTSISAGGSTWLDERVEDLIFNYQVIYLKHKHPHYSGCLYHFFILEENIKGVERSGRSGRKKLVLTHLPI